MRPQRLSSSQALGGPGLLLGKLDYISDAPDCPGLTLSSLLPTLWGTPQPLGRPSRAPSGPSPNSPGHCMWAPVLARPGPSLPSPSRCPFSPLGTTSRLTDLVASLPHLLAAQVPGHLPHLPAPMAWSWGPSPACHSATLTISARHMPFFSFRTSVQQLPLALSSEVASLGSFVSPLTPALGHQGCPSQLLGPPEQQTVYY